MRWLALSLIVAATAAPGAERRPFVSSFERLRVEGPFAVTVTTGAPPGARVSGDAGALDTVEVRQDGATAVVRRATDRWGESGQVAATAPVTVTLFTPTLSGASVIGAGVVTVNRLKGARIDLSVAGTGSLTVAAADGADVIAQSIGNGQITLAGHAARARLAVNGAGAIHADALAADTVVVRLDGPGEVAARARYTADVVNTGLGRVTIAGTPKCQVKTAGGGPVLCGAGASGQ